MCGIVDASVVGDVFGDPDNPFETAKKFREHVNKEKMKLVVAGYLGEETDKVIKAKKWFRQAKLKGHLRQVNSQRVAAETKQLSASRASLGLKSNDPHVLALAKVSGARLLYTNDKDLMDDFRNLNILRPKGKIYSDPQDGKGTFSHVHRKLLQRTVCPR